MTYPIAQKFSNPHYILGVQLHHVDVDQVHAFIEQTIRDNKQANVLNLNINCVNLCVKNVWLRNFINEAPLVFCDGDGVRWGLNLLGAKPPPKITYDRWIWQLAEFCTKKRFSLFLLGGEPGIPEKAAEKLTDKFPELKIAGTHHGYFDKEGSESDRIVGIINEAKADIVVVGFGMPVQERWIERYAQSIQTHIFLTGGAVFDYASGRAKSTPQWAIKLQLEWFYRLCQEPKRLFKRYVIGNPYFFWNVFLEKMKGKKK